MTDRNLKPHPVAHQDVPSYDVFIAGSGPIGATYARLLVDSGLSVVMVEIGDQDTRIPAAHKKNEIEYQKDIDRFVRVIQGALSTVSIPTSSAVMPTLDPAAWQANDPKKRLVSNGRNPRQETWNNLGAQAVTRGVGGMATHWTCSTPEFLKGLERPKIFVDERSDDQEWKLLYSAARQLVGTSETEFDRSIRHNVVLETLQKSIREKYGDSRIVKPLPLACHRLAEHSPYVQWHGADNIYGDLFTDRDKCNKAGVQRGKFLLLTNTRCTRVVSDRKVQQINIQYAEVKDLLADRYTVAQGDTNFAIFAKVFVIAAGAIATPQILANSGFGGNRTEDPSPAHVIPNLGRYITEQPMAFCQIVLNQAIVDTITDFDGKPTWWIDAVKKHQKESPADPLPIPFQDGEPQVTIPVSEKFPWHTQIHRDAFSYGEAGPRVDSRVVVDLRFFGMQEGVKENRIIFEEDLTDSYGMPQPTFAYVPTKKYAQEANRMMADMTAVANSLGGYLPGSSPQFMEPGLALHLGGSTRVGHRAADSVADFNSRVWNFNNLFVAGNGNIPTPFGGNPTLTSMALAIRSAFYIHRTMGQGFKASVEAQGNDGEQLEPTPSEWVESLFNKDDPNFPDAMHLRPVHRYVA
ncbi:putative pyranose oxidase [Rickenella mellea]|uniref:Pyranose 2-oxidase n=1 Tax=Rickenella mellea TaxID=50990 RepID=A0A4Y7Q3D2_9AGAM|nr:putative pyranose oxidase [Rickenella mellea]